MGITSDFGVITLSSQSQVAIDATANNTLLGGSEFSMAGHVQGVTFQVSEQGKLDFC